MKTMDRWEEDVQEQRMTLATSAFTHGRSLLLLFPSTFKRFSLWFSLISTSVSRRYSFFFGSRLKGREAILEEFNTMLLPRFSPSFLVPCCILVFVLSSLQLTQGKSIRSLGYSNLRSNDPMKMRRGGCAAFGHSCFGGHGKRSDGSAEGEEPSTGLQQLMDDGPRTPVDIFAKDQPDADLLLPSQYQNEDYLRFSPIFRKWLTNSYRRGDLVGANN